MKTIHKIFKNKKGIDTILAALLMVVIVVVASVMVYAWSTGLLSSLLVQNPVPRETISMENYAFTGGTCANCNVTLFLRNSGTAAVGLQTYYVKDSSGNTFTLNYPVASQPSISVQAVLPVNILINTACTGCTYQSVNVASPGYQFASGNSYTVQVVTAHNNQFTFTIVR